MREDDFQTISSQSKLFDFGIKETWRYRDLLKMMVKRDFVTYYKQTILGPIWFILVPIMTSVVFTIIFGRIAQISTDGMPQFLFYLSGITIWLFFSDSLNKISTTYRDNQKLFSKVYFPRLVIPLSVIISSCLKLSIQLLILFGFLIYFEIYHSHQEILTMLVILPLLIVNMAILSLGCGLIITSITSKYRDLIFLLQFMLQMLMFATPVIYPIKAIPDQYPLIRQAIELNPLTPIIENFRALIILGTTDGIEKIAYSMGFAIILLCVGTIVFKRRDKLVMDII